MYIVWHLFRHTASASAPASCFYLKVTNVFVHVPVCVCVEGGLAEEGIPVPRGGGLQFSGMHLSPTLNQSGACESDQVPYLRWHSSGVGQANTHATHKHAAVMPSCARTHLVRTIRILALVFEQCKSQLENTIWNLLQCIHIVCRHHTQKLTWHRIKFYANTVI